MKAKLPEFESYGDYKSKGYGAHALKFTVPGFTVWFSYRTPVAFSTCLGGLIVRQNAWGPTTGKHLNWIDGGDKASRVDGATFERMLSEAVSG